MLVVEPELELPLPLLVSEPDVPFLFLLFFPFRPFVVPDMSSVELPPVVDPLVPALLPLWLPLPAPERWLPLELCPEPEPVDPDVPV